MTEESSFADLMARLQAGDEEAAAHVFHRYAQRLIALARSRLSPPIRQKTDPEDVMQSVYKSFFLRQARGQYQLESWDSLWGLLATITLRKCGHHIEHFQAACRDVYRERSHRAGPDDSTASWQAIAREPTPAEAALLAETVEEAMRGLEGQQRLIFQLSLQGHSTSEICSQVACTERTVQRVLARIRLRLEQVRAGPEEMSDGRSTKA
jgi:RNA polymerase sigma-70 factor (ECF subfamily)